MQTRSRVPSGAALVWILPALLATLWASGCAVEVDRVGLLCNEAEPCEPGLSCIDGRCEFVRTLAIGDTLPPGRRGQTYRGDVEITGGTPPYELEVLAFSGGALALQASGTQLFTENPLAEGVYDVEVRVTDSGLPPEIETAQLELDVRGLPTIDTVAAVDTGDTLPVGSRTFVGNTIALADGRWATALLRLRQEDANTITPEVAVLVGDTTSDDLELFTVSGGELAPAQPNQTRDVPLAMPQVYESSGYLWVGYAAQNDDSSHSMGVTRIDLASGDQRHVAYDLNSGTLYALGMVVVDGKLFTAAMSVSITADIVLARIGVDSMAVEERRAESFSGVRNEERTGLAMLVIGNEPWVFAASKLGGYAAMIDKENLDRLEGDGLDLEVENYFDVRVALVGDTIVHAWARGTGVATIDLYRTPVGSLESPGELTSLTEYAVSTEAARYGSFELATDGAELVVLAINAADNTLVGSLGSVDGTTFEALDLDLGTVPGSTPDALRATPSIVRRSDNRYQLLWSEQTDAATGERRLYRALTVDP